MDIKSNFDNYQKISGIKNNALIKKIQKSKNILIKNKKVNYEFRTTVIQEFHNLKTLLKIAKSIKNCQKYVLQKYQYSQKFISNILELKSILNKIITNKIFYDKNIHKKILNLCSPSDELTNNEIKNLISLIKRKIEDFNQFYYKKVEQSEDFHKKNKRYKGTIRKNYYKIFVQKLITKIKL